MWNPLIQKETIALLLLLLAWKWRCCFSIWRSFLHDEKATRSYSTEWKNSSGSAPYCFCCSCWTSNTSMLLGMKPMPFFLSLSLIWVNQALSCTGPDTKIKGDWNWLLVSTLLLVLLQMRLTQRDIHWTNFSIFTQNKYFIN